MRRKKGYIAVEAVIVTTMVAVMGFAVLVANKDSLGTAAARVLGLTYKLTQNLDNKLDTTYVPVDNPNGEWDTDNGNTIKDGVSSGQIPVQTIALNIGQSQTMAVGAVRSATATVTPAPTTTGQVAWTVVTGSDYVVLSCIGTGDCLSVNITAIKPGIAIVRAAVRNNSAFKDIIITIE